MRRGEAVTRIKAAGRARNVILAGHARRRLSERQLALDDLYHAMENVRDAREQHGGTFAVAAGYTWKCRGPALGGGSIGFVAAIQEDVLIVTLYDPEAD